MFSPAKNSLLEERLKETATGCFSSLNVLQAAKHTVLDLRSLQVLKEAKSLQIHRVNFLAF